MTFNNKGLMSSDSIEWHTPDYIVKWCQDKFFISGHIFSLDVASTNENKKAPSNYTKQQNGLIRPWFGHVWLNPPYGREISQWIRRTIKSLSDCNSITLLLPARTDTRWFFDLVQNNYEKHIYFLKGRIKFSGKGSAPFPSVIVHLKPNPGLTSVKFVSIPKEAKQ